MAVHLPAIQKDHNPDEKTWDPTGKITKLKTGKGHGSKGLGVMDPEFKPQY
jgi:hypothetical protein